MRTAWAADHILFNDGNTKFSNLSMVESKNLHGMSMERPVTTSMHRTGSQYSSCRTVHEEGRMQKKSAVRHQIRQVSHHNGQVVFHLKLPLSSAGLKTDVIHLALLVQATQQRGPSAIGFTASTANWQCHL